MNQSERTELTYHRSVTLSEWIGATIFKANKSQKEMWKGEKSRPLPLEQFCQNKTTKLNLNQINSLARNTHCRKLKGQRNRLNDTVWIKSATFLRCGKLYRTNNLTSFSSSFFVFLPHHMVCGILVSWPGIEPANLTSSNKKFQGKNKGGGGPINQWELEIYICQLILTDRSHLDPNLNNV